ncbi:hypothetical protein AMIS_26050 [Actinoplanes missouriensis 431]|uniref:Uncharacterized protein n=1 Tax=Actinoplanes missouriensis (strain ATCC 14538 / DSM 43046 / CBS 188.64 / JCM 3121 / NBRC 102363 / NCIMB 12654 / NRRL B-3342 / UNCC 431) TaxID=512565 RepID=I0H488_ACTM4|nr:hypothetical protein [Actinoplanes missouriensis]BAL87825.1 hypothetical protein AMIS_26050 [Actinoplanes missouriensis 431]
MLEAVQEGAPAPRTSTADIIAAAHRIRRRRRWGAVAGAGSAALLTVAVVATITGTVPRASDPNPPAAATPTTSAAPREFRQPTGLRFTAGTSRAGAWQIGPARSVTYGYQEIPVYRDGRTLDVDGVPYPLPDAVITLHRPGRYDIADFGTTDRTTEKYGPPKTVTVAGRPGIERAYTYEMPDLVDLRAKLAANPGMKPNDPSIRTESFTRTALAWQFDGTSWATFLPWRSRDPLSREDSLAIVEALVPQPAESIRAPYTFGWLPAGWRVTAAQWNAADRDPQVSKVVLDRQLPTGAELVAPLDYYPGGGQLTIHHGRPKPSNAPGNGQDIKCIDADGYCTMVINGEYFAELQRVGRGLSIDDVRRILRELRFTELSDPSTWQPLG